MENEKYKPLIKCNFLNEVFEINAGVQGKDLTIFMSSILDV